jgi:hypothetical protein
MSESFLREPQVELFFQAYFVGLAIGHLPFFFEFGLIGLFWRFIFSLPFVFVLFIFYRIKFAEINSRPILWSSIVFMGISALIAVALFLLSDIGVQDITLRDLTLLSFLLLISLPSVLVSCIYFVVIITLQSRKRSVG